MKLKFYPLSFLCPNYVGHPLEIQHKWCIIKMRCHISCGMQSVGVPPRNKAPSMPACKTLLYFIMHNFACLSVKFSFLIQSHTSLHFLLGLPTPLLPIHSPIYSLHQPIFINSFNMFIPSQGILTNNLIHTFLHYILSILTPSIPLKLFICTTLILNLPISLKL